VKTYGDEDNTRYPGILMRDAEVGHYRVIEKIGSGGMGDVYLAEDKSLGRQVALKFLSEHLCRDSECRSRFAREAQAAARLNHPNIVTIHQVDALEGRPYFVMEYIQGRSLRDIVREGCLSIVDTERLLVQICNGLCKAHAARIIHRDLKPSNVIVDSDKRAKLIDFGLAMIRGGQQLTKDDSTIGTVGYMSPEQVEGKRVDERSDLFSLGVILYEMLTGVSPFARDNEAATLHSIMYDTPEPVGNLREDTPVVLQQIVDKLLRKDPAARYQSVGELLNDIGEPSSESWSRTTPMAGHEPYPSVAVLPFANLSADPNQEYFCDGIVEEIINALTHLRNLRVVARTSSFAFKGKQVDIREIARALGVRTLLEGSVRKEGRKLRITVQLINATDGFHLWSEKFDRDAEDIFAIQDEISLAVVDRLEVQLYGGERTRLMKRYTENPKAHTLYLRGRFFWNQRTAEGLRKSLEHFQAAIQEDPDYALAYSGLADAYSMLFHYGSVSYDEAFANASRAATKALELDDSLAEAHASMGQIKHRFQKDLPGAEKEFRRAIELNPDYPTVRHWYSGVLLEMGRGEDALKEVERALEVDPVSPTLLMNLAYRKRERGDWDGAVETFQRLCELQPENEIVCLNFAGVLLQMGREDEALATIRRGLELSPENPAVLGFHITVLYSTRRYDDVIEQIARVEKQTGSQAPFGRLLLGQAYLQKGMYDKALAEFKRVSELSAEGTHNIDLSVLAESMAGVTLAKQGHLDQAEKILSNLIAGGRDGTGLWGIAALCFALGKMDEGFEFLRNSVEKKTHWLGWIKVNPLFDDARSDSRFQAILSDMGLQE
jgi:serine/threonine protein kinase/tetratricopeptide (TPR) repeat protein